VRPDAVRAPSVGVDLAFRLGGTAQPGELGGHETGLFEAGGLKTFRVERGPAEWRAAEPVEPVRADVLLALGFEVAGPPSVFYAAGASFSTEVPSRSASRAAR
jgi:hypothetical protein